jgi:cytochrome d ubiquinol oxidase subunit II
MDNALPYLWFFLLDVTLVLFVILDGAGLGIGVLSLAAREKERSVMAAAVGPLWYANETWLVIAGAVLFGAFPAAYAVVLSSLYVPAMMLVFGLMLRAVSAEFRDHGSRTSFWGAAFGIGCLVAILGLGFIFGGVAGTLRMENGSFAGGPWDWLNGLSIVFAASTLVGFVMLGAAYLVRTAEGEVQMRARRLLRGAAPAAFALFIAAFVIMQLAHKGLSATWARPPRAAAVSFFLAAGAVSAAMLVRSSVRGRDGRAPFAWSVALFLCAAGTMIAATFPYLLPLSLSIADAASPRMSLAFMLIGAGAILPIIVGYNIYIRRVFARKIHGDGTGY